MTNNILLIDNDKHETITIFEDMDNELYLYMIEAYEDFFEDEPVELKHETLWGWFPTFYWPTEFVGIVTQAFGINEQYYSQFGLPGHEGIDLRAYHNTEIRCVWDGEITRIAEYGAYGKQVRVKHLIDGNDYESTYAHLNNWLADLSVGDLVTRGQLLGKADSTGNSTGSHLHVTLKQFSGEKPNTPEQNDTKQYDEWPYDIIDPTPFFKELNL